jgi:hypothetical protein
VETKNKGEQISASADEAPAIENPKILEKDVGGALKPCGARWPVSQKTPKFASTT